VAAGDEELAGVGVGEVGEVGDDVFPLPHPNTPAASEPMKMTTSRRERSGSFLSFSFMGSLAHAIDVPVGAVIQVAMSIDTEARLVLCAVQRAVRPGRQVRRGDKFVGCLRSWWKRVDAPASFRTMATVS
jgi:hypothetical protein